MSSFTKSSFLLLGLVLLVLLHLPAKAAREATAESHEIQFAPVLSRVDSGWVDWSDLVLHVRAEALPAAGTLRDRSVVEQQALDSLPSLMSAAAESLMLTPDTSAGDVLGQGGPTRHVMDHQFNTWRVFETRYYDSGKVQLEAHLDLGLWLRRPLMELAQAERPGGERSLVTGIVIDARGLGMDPLVAPDIYSSNGRKLYGIRWITPFAIKKHSPVQWVSDPADPRAIQRAGDNPLFLAAYDLHDEHSLVLDEGSSQRLVTIARDPHILAEARVVLVTDTESLPP